MADLEIALFGRRGLRPSRQANFNAVNVLCRDDSGLAVLQADGEARIGVLHGAEILVRPPVLREGLCFVGEKIREVGLVVGIDARHEFDVGAAVVGKFAVPCVAERMVSPRPLFLAGGDVAVGNVDETTMRGVVVAAEKVIVGGAYHVRCRHGDVLVPCKTVRAGTFRVIDAVVDSVGARERGRGTDCVIGDIGDVGGEEAFVLVVDTRGDVRPPVERLRERGTVVEPGL